jgi:hypothetical protein
MSNVKISSLPSYTGNTSGSWLVMNNSGETTTFKVQRETLLSGFQPSGNYATTGSNVFRGDQTISGSVLLAGPSNRYRVFGQFGNTGSYNEIGATFTQDNTTDSTRYENGAFAFNKGTGSYSFQALHNTFNITTNNKNINITGSLIASGSLHKFIGSTTITGSVNITGSLNITGVNNYIIATGSLGNNNNLTVYNGNNTITSVNGGFVTLNAFDGNGGIKLNAYNSPGGIDMSGSLRVIGNTTITGSLTASGSIIQTGSVQGNVFPLSISSNTASLNLNNGNFFTLQLVSGSATHLNPSNIKPGQTVSVFVNTIGSATMTFPSSIKQISGSSYVPTTSTGLDILTLVSRDSSNLYLVNAKNFI